MTYGVDYWDLQTGEATTDEELHERFDDMLDECYPDMPFNLTASEILKSTDPIQYRVAFSEWLDSELGESLTDEEPDEDDEEEECRHCGQRIVLMASGSWVDPVARGDDGLWRETCDSHETFSAEHEPH